MQLMTRLLLLLLAVLPVLAVAGGQATIRSESGQMDIRWRDADTLRLQTRGEQDYFILRDGKAYAVTRQGGQTRVMDMGAMMQMMRGMAGKDAPAETPNFGDVGSIEATGETETVAGVRGRVYRMEWTDHEGQRQQGEAVLTDDPLVVELTRAYTNSIQAMFGGKTGNFLEELPSDRQGMLRSGDSYRVESISDEAPPASAFELPAEPMDLQKMLQGRFQQ